MLERKKLNKLVIMTLSHNKIAPLASELFTQIRAKDVTLRRSILREEQVASFRSFVKVLNSFDEVQASGVRFKRYSLKNQHTEIF